MKIPFGGRVLLIGAGAVSRCLQPLLLRHLDMDYSRLTILDMRDVRAACAELLAAGAHFVQRQITPENMAGTLAQFLGPGDLLIDLAYGIGMLDIIGWCHDHGVLYINTSIEVWDPVIDISSQPPTERTLYVRHMALRRLQTSWASRGPTMVIEHGANPGLVSHWTKVGLEDIAQAMLARGLGEPALERALADADYPALARPSGVRVIHISERDTQITSEPKQQDEFVNTWSVKGFYEEGMSPAELGWGTHERRLPAEAQLHACGPRNQICIARMGITVWVHSWVPSGEIIGMLVRHGEAFTLSDFLTVWEDDCPVYRPTVHYAYVPCDAALNSLHELRMRGLRAQSRMRILNDDIIDGRDELGVLLLGHALNGWWVGSQLDIHETRRLAPSQYATTLQVAAPVIAALFWMIAHPAEGLCTPEQLPHRDILAVAARYLGPCPSLQTDWTPLRDRFRPFGRYGQQPPPADLLWQFESFLAHG